MSLEGCTRFADGAGNALSLGSGCGARRRRALSGSAAASFEEDEEGGYDIGDGEDARHAIAVASRRWRLRSGFAAGGGALAPELPEELLPPQPTEPIQPTESTERSHRRQLQGISAAALGISTPSTDSNGLRRGQTRASRPPPARSSLTAPTSLRSTSTTTRRPPRRGW